MPCANLRPTMRAPGGTRPRRGPPGAGASPPPSGARALLIGLAGLLALELAGTLVPGSWLWGANLGRYLPRGWAPALLALGLGGLALAAVPGLRRPAGALRPSGAFVATVLAIACAALCWALPDRTLFTGDFLYRQGTVAAGADPRQVLPQALPLDVALHVTLPRALVARAHVPANLAGRLLGVADAAAWGASAWALASALGLEGWPAIGLAIAALLGGPLTLFTGYDKSFAEMAVLTLAAGACAVRLARSGRGLLPLAVLVSVAVTLHRSGLALLPLWAAACVVAARGGSARRATLIVALALPVVTLALALPGIVAAMKVLDARHLAPAEVRRTGFLWAALSPGHLRDLFNVVSYVAPVAWLAVPLAPAVGSRFWRGREAALLLALAAPFVGLLLFVRPIQGPFRDVDVFVPAGTALAVTALALAAEALRGPRLGALALATACVTAGPALAALVHLSDPPLATERIRGWLAGPPEPDPTLAANGWDYLAMRAMGRQDWAAAAEAFDHAVALAPNPRFYVQWGMAVSMLGDRRRAQDLYARAVRLNPDLTLGWLGLAATSSWLDDVPQVRRATTELRRLDPGNPQLPELEAYLRRRGAGPP